MSTSETPPLNSPNLWWPSPPEIIIYLFATAVLSKKFNLPFYMCWFVDIVLHVTLPFICLGIILLLAAISSSLWYMVRIGFAFNLLEGPLWCLVNLVCLMTVDPLVFQNVVDFTRELLIELPNQPEKTKFYFKQALYRIKRGQYPQ